MVRALNSKNKLGFANGSIKAPSQKTDPDLYATWSRCNDMVHSWIVNACEPEIADSVIYYSNAYEVWEDLHECFSQGNATRIFEIQRDIASLRQEQLSVSAYYTKLKALWDELEALDVTQAAQSDQQRLMQFLMGLNETYQAIRGQFLLMKPLPTVRQAFSSVSQEEKQRLITSAPFNQAAESGSAAMAVRSSNVKPASSTDIGKDDRSTGTQEFRRNNGRTDRGYGGRRNDQNQRRFGSERKRPHCTHCGEVGHWVQTCYELCGYPMGHPKARNNPNAKLHNNSNGAAANNVSDGRPLVSLFEDQLKQLLSLIHKQDDSSSSKANAVTKPGSGYEEDDWFG
ncbi:hypothetical protein ACHQM5_008742 [Ranunculus cassubicifolius]